MSELRCVTTKYGIGLSTPSKKEAGTGSVTSRSQKLLQATSWKGGSETLSRSPCHTDFRLRPTQAPRAS